MDGNNSVDNQDIKMWTLRIEMKLVNMLREEVKKNQITGCTTVWTVRLEIILQINCSICIDFVYIKASKS